MKKYPQTQFLKSILDDIDPLCFPLLRWIISSNRSHLSPIPSQKKILEMKTFHQYVLCSSNPARERNFREMRMKIASKFGGRGSFYGKIFFLFSPAIFSISWKFFIQLALHLASWAQEL